MHLSLTPPPSRPEARARRALLEADLVWLREELAGAKSPEQKASLLYQIGTLEQLAGRDASAVRQLLAAVNTLSHFKEPLERLIALIERHRSFKNLPTLLDHLCRTAEGSEELARAKLAQAWCFISHGPDVAAALPLADAALLAAPHDPAAALTLELLARRTGDAAALRRALEARRASALGGTWAALFELELAEIEAGAGELARAYSRLADAAAGPLGWRALDTLEELGRSAAREDFRLAALEARAARSLAALDGSTEPMPPPPLGGDWLGVALDALLWKAEIERRSGRGDTAFATLERAARVAPDHPIVSRALLEQARALGRHDRVEALTARELEATPTTAEAAALWLGLGEAHVLERRPRDALAALRRALELDPECWLARARELELLREAGDVEAEAFALEQIARGLTGDPAQSRYWLLAAGAWARGPRRSSAARAALEQAEHSGAPSILVRRLARALAQLLADRDWQGAAARRLLASDVDEGERAALVLESWRLALLGADAPTAHERLTELDAHASGRRLARVARAFALDAGAAEASGAALAELAEIDPDATRAAALGWVHALRTKARAGSLAAIEALERVHRRHPAAAALTGTLAIWLRDAGEPARAAAVLRGSAAALRDTPLAASLYVEAGLSCWWAGERDAARRDFDAAERALGGARGQVLSLWARRASVGFGANPDPSASDPSERLLGALERATATAEPGATELTELGAALRTAEEGGSGLAIAAQLARLVLARALGARIDPGELERAVRASPELEHVIESFRYLDCIAQPEPSPRTLEEITRRWAADAGGLVAALEWVAACARLGQRAFEATARESLAARLSGSAAEQTRASAALLVHLTQDEPAPLCEAHTPAGALTNLETSPPGCDPRRRARALEDAAEHLGADAEPMLGLLRGYNQLAAGDVEAAIGSFRRYTDSYGDDPSGWDGLLAAARRVDDPALLAEAASRLGSTCRDPGHAARLFEEAAEVFFERLGDEVAGQAALARALQLDMSRASSFERLRRSLRETSSRAELMALIERRLPLAASQAEIVDLSWELALLRREAGDLEGTGRALARLAEHDPEHLGALLSCAELDIRQHRYAEAVERLARVAARPDASAEQRSISGLVAVDLCETQLGATERALDLLSQLERAGLSDVALRERLARSTAKAGAWPRAVALFERLMLERETAAERAEAARLALLIHRDRLGDPGAAGPAAKAVLEASPDDPDALDLVLSGALEAATTTTLLEAGREALIRALAQAPSDVDAMQRLARIAERLGDAPLRQATLGALLALGQAEPQSSRAELVRLERRISTLPPAPVTGDVLAGLADPEDTGPVPELLSLVAPHLGEVFGPRREAFQVGRRERVSSRETTPLRDEIAAWANAFGVDEFELYVSPLPSEQLVVLGTEPITIIAGASVSAPLGPFQRQALARALYAFRRGLSPLLDLDAADVPALIGALCSLAQVDLGGPPHPRQRDFERQLARVLPRKTRKLLSERARRVREAEPSLGAWIRAASASLDRVAAVAVGDASVILADVPPDALASGPGQERARRLLSFMLSPAFDALRQRFGVSLR